MMVIVAIYGAAQAFFDPASDAIVPELLPSEQLGEANALEQFVRPLALRLAGPALGGVLVGGFGAGAAFLADGATFVASAAALWSMSARVSPCGTPSSSCRGPLERALAARFPDRARGEAVRRRRGALLGIARAARAARGLELRAPARVAVGDVRERRASRTCCSWVPRRCCCRSW